MTRKVLGRGLSALLREVETTASGLEQVPVSLIDPNPLQPRRNISDDGLQELAESIRSTGVVQPVLVRRADGRYQLVAGERRWRAARLAGVETIPAVIRDLSDREALELALTENLLREDLNPLEVASAFRALQDTFHLSHEEIAARLGINRTTVSNTLRLLKLAPEVQEMLSRGKISAGHARALLAVADNQAQVALAKRIDKEGLSVRQAEALAGGPEAREKKAAKGESDRNSKLDPNTRAAVIELERTLGTRVRITGDSNRGKIEISYFSSEDLQRIYDIIARK